MLARQCVIQVITNGLQINDQISFYKLSPRFTQLKISTATKRVRLYCFSATRFGRVELPRHIRVQQLSHSASNDTNNQALCRQLILVFMQTLLKITRNKA